MATRGKKEKEYPPMPANWMYKRGDVYMMDLNPYSGSEQGGIRPAIVVQNDDGNFYSNVLLVVPLTTQIKKRNMPMHFVLHNRFLSAPSMAICESPRPADKSRVLSYLGHLSKYEMRQVSVCLQYSFGFIGYNKGRLIAKLRQVDAFTIFRLARTAGVSLPGKTKYLQQVYTIYNGGSRRAALPLKF